METRITIKDQDQPLPFTRDVWISYGIFFLYSVLWYGAAFLFKFSARETTFWLVAVSMSAAHIYYVIQAYASTGGRSKMDLALNFIQAAATTFLIVAHLSGAISPRASLGLVGIVAFAHPLMTDWHHIRRYFRTDVANYVPPACIFVDFSAATFVLIALLY